MNRRKLIHKLFKNITAFHRIPKFCHQCGCALQWGFVQAEDQERLCCRGCGHITYLNPLLVAGALPIKEGKVILLRRGIEPRKHFWTFPAGFVELGESIEEGAIRESLEEVGVKIVIKGLVGVYSYPQSIAATVVYEAQVKGGRVRTSNEAEEIQYFSPKEIPWKDLAFESTRDALHDWESSCRGGLIPVCAGNTCKGAACCAPTRARPLCSTLCYVQKNGQTLMLHRAKKMGKIYDDKWNGLGGKMEAGESPEDCVIREVWEESGLKIRQPKLKGMITFPSFDGVEDWIVFVFVADKFSGKLMDQSPEGDLEWIPNLEVAHLNLWEGDKYFMKHLNSRKFFTGKFIYKNGKYIKHDLVFYGS